ncbi:MAG: hypothetical protein MUF77_02005 [Leptospira sp.]|jgi:hypothetical protein|nr:hypothetical protein [Leptospira sp.]
MAINKMIVCICLLLFSCAGNFFPNDEETGKAARQRCAEALIALSETDRRNENCDACLLGIIRNCKPKKSGQLIKF